MMESELTSFRFPSEAWNSRMPRRGSGLISKLMLVLVYYNLIKYLELNLADSEMTLKVSYQEPREQLTIVRTETTPEAARNAFECLGVRSSTLLSFGSPFGRV